ncbi:MAG: hypothetical protein VKK04_06790 [Synechococcales bacterium]|nr:hypothetical protein [Synechococcales bacterium]
MTHATSLATAPDLSADDYLVVGLAHCFLKEDGEIHEVQVMEPIPSATLETLLQGTATSYNLAYATTIGAILGDRGVQIPPEFPATTQVCDQFEERAIAAARTYRSKPSVQTALPQGTLHRDFNFSLERKRILNSERIVKTEDNVRQHEYTHKTL